MYLVSFDPIHWLILTDVERRRCNFRPDPVNFFLLSYRGMNWNISELTIYPIFTVLTLLTKVWPTWRNVKGMYLVSRNYSGICIHFNTHTDIKTMNKFPVKWKMSETELLGSGDMTKDLIWAILNIICYKIIIPPTSHSHTYNRVQRWFSILSFLRLNLTVNTLMTPSFPILHLQGKLFGAIDRGRWGYKRVFSVL